MRASVTAVMHDGTIVFANSSQLISGVHLALHNTSLKAALPYRVHAAEHLGYDRQHMS